MVTRKTAEEVRTNIAALLARLNITASTLAGALGKNRSWMTRFLAKKRHELQLCDIDKIAAFLEVAPYDLVKPSNGSLTDRRRARWDRRVEPDRRRSWAQRQLQQTAAGIDRARRPRGNAQLEPDERRLIDYLRAHPDDKPGVFKSLELRADLQKPKPTATKPDTVKLKRS